MSKLSFNYIQEYVISVYYRTREGEKEQIARFDDSHGFKHFDRFFEDHPYKDKKHATPAKSFWELYEFAEKKWKTWAKRYD